MTMRMTYEQIIKATIDKPYQYSDYAIDDIEGRAHELKILATSAKPLVYDHLRVNAKLLVTDTGIQWEPELIDFVIKFGKAVSLLDDDESSNDTCEQFDLWLDNDCDFSGGFIESMAEILKSVTE